MRVFISLEFPENILEIVKEVQQKLPEFIGKKTEKENLHLTLKFLGEIEEDKVEIVKKRLESINFKKFEASLGEIGVFSEDFIRIVWIHVTNCDELQKRIDECLEDLFPKEKRFMSHLTIARVKKVLDKKSFLEKIRKINFQKESFTVKKFFLKESLLRKEGPVYKTLKEYNLS
ncbi:MAG: RNA 2',3'-cyclic phosphodiesterase [Candidatus Pacearchaeota archaeon]